MKPLNEALEILIRNRDYVSSRQLRRLGCSFWDLQHLLDLGLCTHRQCKEETFYRARHDTYKSTLERGVTNSIYRRNMANQAKWTYQDFLHDIHRS